MTLHEVKPSLLQVTVLQGVLASVKLTPNTMAMSFLPTASYCKHRQGRTTPHCIVPFFWRLAKRLTVFFLLGAVETL